MGTLFLSQDDRIIFLTCDGRISHVARDGISGFAMFDIPFAIGMSLAIINNDTCGRNALIIKNSGKLKVGTMFRARKIRIIGSIAKVLDLSSLEAEVLASTTDPP